MALSFGKKKKQAAETDWSENALREDAPARTAPAEAVPDDGVTVPDADAAPKKKNPVLMAGIAALVLIVGGAAAYFLVLAPSDELDEEPAQEVVRNVPPSPDDPGAVIVGDDPPPEAVAPPGTDTIDVSAGDAGIAPEDAKPPIIQNPNVVSAPRLVPGPAVPTPVQPPQGLAGTPGRYGTREVRIAPVTAPPGFDPILGVPDAANPGAPRPLTPDLQRQLEALWEQGAAAKHRGDYEAARQSWQRMLELRPGHPGIQEAIDKLPG